MKKIQNKTVNRITNLIPCLSLENPIEIQAISPQIDHGQFFVKAIQGETILVEADIFAEGHDLIQAQLKYKEKGASSWQIMIMKPLVNDRWQASFTPTKNTRYLYTIEAWINPLTTWLKNIEKKCLANQNVPNDISEGIKILSEWELPVKEKKAVQSIIQQLEWSKGVFDEVLNILQNKLLHEKVEKFPVKQRLSEHSPLEMVVDRKRAQYSAWYELFPRSQGTRQDQSATFKDCIKRLPDIKKMGFDVIYLPPIHPIGTTHRKGKNNALASFNHDPGSPWAIGSKDGGHKAIHPELGSFADFDGFVKEAEKKGIEIALDLAYQCSPDHPYVKQHPEWFYRYPDGHIHYAENPPKKYEDIYPLNFYSENASELWEELKSIVLFWIQKGVKIFRVDNPHTKPFLFWKWLIEEIQNQYPEVLFLSEAFTRPKIMKHIAKIGFTQSYTYFTWRNFKSELREYLEELTQTEMKNYFRGNFFANTPDILHEYLQKGGRPAFKIRTALAATLSSSYGIYSGFELCENTPKAPGSEEYLDSEKYEYKIRNWNQSGHIKDFISRINLIREENLALQEYKNLTFYDSRNENILCYGKKTKDLSNIIVVVVNLDPFHPHEDIIRLPLWDLGIEEWQTYQVKDLLTGEKYYWRGSENFIRLDPNIEPAHIFRIKK